MAPVQLLRPAPPASLVSRAPTSGSVRSHRNSQPPSMRSGKRAPRLAVVAASSGGGEEEPQESSKAAAKNKPLPGSGVNLFDPAATASRFLTRRFGIIGGLGFVALLASTELFEIGKALFEVDKEGSGERVESSSGLAYRDIKVGGGAQPRKGDFVGTNLIVKVDGKVLLDTKASGRAVAFTFGKRPFLSVNCEGLEEGLSTMRRGGQRELEVPSSLAYGSAPRELPNGEMVPAGADVSILVTLEEVTGSYL